MLLAMGGAAALPAALPRIHIQVRGRPLQALDPHQAETVATIAELIIPATNTPGAREAQVPEFIDVILAEWYEDADKERFLAGLTDVDERSRSLTGKPFIEAGEAVQVAVLKGMEAEAIALRKADKQAPTHFWHRIKSLTLYGYYNSEPGNLQELKRPVLPGRFDPCLELGAARPGAL
jgi:hypothetical protein